MAGLTGGGRVGVVIFGVIVLAGCAADTDGSKQSPIPTAPAAGGASDLSPKKAEFPDLPEGAGEIDKDAPSELTPTGSGLYYRILREGSGKKPTRAHTVVAHYRGWLDNGKEFDSSYARGETAEFPLGQVVPGWTEGLQLVGEGGMIELEIPSKLGYGSGGRPPKIPPGATLHFIVELQKVK